MSEQQRGIIATVAEYGHRYPCPYCGVELEFRYPAVTYRSDVPGDMERSLDEAIFIVRHGHAVATFTHADALAGFIDEWAQMLDRVVDEEQRAAAYIRWSALVSAMNRTVA